MEPVVMAGAVLLLVAVAMLPFVLVVGLLLGALRTILDVKPWLHDEVPTVDAWATTDRRAPERERTSPRTVDGHASGDDAPAWRRRLRQPRRSSSTALAA